MIKSCIACDNQNNIFGIVTDSKLSKEDAFAECKKYHISDKYTENDLQTVTLNILGTHDDKIVCNISDESEDGILDKAWILKI